jgi:predicted alpha/beta superfamily hydrolase
MKQTALFLASLILISGCLFNNKTKVTVKVIVPPSTPKDATIFITGNSDVIGNWDPAKVPMTNENDSTWSFTADGLKGTLAEFKITRGAWANQAIYQKGIIPDNFRFVLNSDTTIVVRPISWNDMESINSGMKVTGTVAYHRGLKASGLRHSRDVIVWLPPSYDIEKERRYRVLYMHDGQNIIDPSTSFIGIDWQVDEVIDSLSRQGKMEEIIVVGIYNSPDRYPEYSDTDLGKSYGEFLVKTLKPMIDSTYRTKPDKKNTAVMGSSMGGLISFLIVWWYPEVFYQAGCLSPAFVDRDFKSVKDVKAFNGKKDIRIYIDNGTVGLESQLQPGYDAMKEVLESKGYQKGKDLEYFIDVGAVHNEAAWAKRLWRPLIFMFGK